MMMVVDKLDIAMKSMLQKHISVVINNKSVREGTLILYNIKDYYVTLNIKTKKDQVKTYEIPIPYQLYINTDNTVFDYHVNHIIREDPKRRWLINVLYKKVGKKSKLYDNILTIKYSE
jgi:N-glycosylase/DNA lyase